MNDPLSDCQHRIDAWIHDPKISDSDKLEVEALIKEQNIAELRDRFYRDLEIGTGGLRGVMGAGTNRMNGAVIGRVCQGLANSLIAKQQDHVAIAYDSRHKSKEFAHNAAEVLAANGLRVSIFPELQTTPALSFAIRHLGCAAGLCITASHNPPKYNGVKIYGNDGAQVIAPQDKEILKAIFAIESWGEIKRDVQNRELIQFISEDTLVAYYQQVLKLQLWPQLNKDIHIVYTPLHGTGAKPVRHALKQWGYKMSVVPEQEQPDGAFPTVVQPNPEDPRALKMALELAHTTNADLVVANDPDSDRLALAIRDPKSAKSCFGHQSQGDFVLLNGNQSGALLIDYVLCGHAARGTLQSNHKIIKTIVTSELHRLIAAEHGIETFDTLTGFKWIAGLVRKWEQEKSNHKYLFGTEESFGFMPSDFLRDKDGVAALCQAAEMTAWHKSMGVTACERLLFLFQKHGYWLEDLINIDLEGEAGATRIQHVMSSLRNKVPQSLCGQNIMSCIDFENQTLTANGKTEVYNPLPKSNVLQLNLGPSGLGRVTFRPSGTEPKLKIYTSLQSNSANSSFEKLHEKSLVLRNEILALIETL